jgi:hypothetical protein
VNKSQCACVKKISPRSLDLSEFSPATITRDACDNLRMLALWIIFFERFFRIQDREIPGEMEYRTEVILGIGRKNTI